MPLQMEQFFFTCGEVLLCREELGQHIVTLDVLENRKYWRSTESYDANISSRNSQRYFNAYIHSNAWIWCFYSWKDKTVRLSTAAIGRHEAVMQRGSLNWNKPNTLRFCISTHGSPPIWQVLLEKDKENNNFIPKFIPELKQQRQIKSNSFIFWLD